MPAGGDGLAEIRAALGESRRLLALIGLFSASVNLLMLTALINSAPLAASITDPAERSALANRLVSPISHALIGSENVQSAPLLNWLDTRLKARFPRLFEGARGHDGEAH